MRGRKPLDSFWMPLGALYANRLTAWNTYKMWYWRSQSRGSCGRQTHLLLDPVSPVEEVTVTGACHCLLLPVLSPSLPTEPWEKGSWEASSGRAVHPMCRSGSSGCPHHHKIASEGLKKEREEEKHFWETAASSSGVSSQRDNHVLLKRRTQLSNASLWLCL